MRPRRLILTLGIATTLSCGGKAGTPPSPVIDDPTITCPEDVSALAHNGQPPVITFDTPATAKGSPPVTVTCNPSAGSEFPVGTNQVMCEASDSRMHKATCSFSIVIASVPRLTKTTFLTLGDSLTEGKTDPSFTVLRVPDVPGTNPPQVILNVPGSYPELLEAKLSARYQDQTVTIVTYGVGGEKAFAGKERLKTHWSEFNPDAVLILEGLNDLSDPSTATPQGMQQAIDTVISALRDDIGVVRSHGSLAFLATLLPIGPNSSSNVVAGIVTLNGRIKTLANAESVPLVDLNAVVDSSEIGNLHPKMGGTTYNKIADEWLKAIIATMEVKN